MTFLSNVVLAVGHVGHVGHASKPGYRLALLSRHRKQSIVKCILGVKGNLSKAITRLIRICDDNLSMFSVMEQKKAFEKCSNRVAVNYQ